MIIGIKVCYIDKLRIRFFLGDFNFSGYMIIFNIVMGWIYFNDEEKGVIFC